MKITLEMNNTIAMVDDSDSHTLPDLLAVIDSAIRLFGYHPIGELTYLEEHDPDYDDSKEDIKNPGPCDMCRGRTIIIDKKDIIEEEDNEDITEDMALLKKAD